MPTEVFICHSSHDELLAGQLAAFLEEQKIGCWFVSQNLSLGDHPVEAGMRNLLDCPVVVLIFSPSANDSARVEREIEAAAKAGKVLILFRIAQVPPSGRLETFFRHRYVQDAFAGPLEKHLEDLARVLRPLVQKRKVIASDEASISRTLPSRAAILRNANDRPNLSGLSPNGSLQVAWKTNRALRAGVMSECSCRLENLGPDSLQDIRLAFESRSLNQIPTQSLNELAPGSSHTFRLELKPAKSGTARLSIRAEWTRAGKRQGVAGIESLHIDEPLPGANLSRATQIIAPTHAPEAQGEEPADFETIGLSSFYEVSLDAMRAAGLRQPLSIPPSFLGANQKGTIFKMEALGPSPDAPYQDFRLVGRASFGLGRSREDSDFVLWFWPRNEVHDTKTRRISKKHCTLTVENFSIHVRNSAAASLTTLDGEDLGGLEGVPLHRSVTLGLSGIYNLEVDHFPGSFPLGPSVSNLSDWAGHGRETLASGVNGSVRVTSLTPNTLPQNSFWLLTDATVGSSRYNPIVLEEEGLSEIQCRFYYFLKSFWLENLVDNDAVQVNGQKVAPGSIVPLVSGQEICLGRTNYYLTLSP